MTPLTPAPDASAADWIVKALQTFGESVLSLVPAGFAAYARVFHPAWQLDDDGYATISVPWADVARANGTRANPAMQFRAVMSAPTFEHNIDPQPGVFAVPTRTVARRPARPVGMVRAGDCASSA